MAAGKGALERPQESVIARDARTNRRIRAREVRVIGAEGEQLGILPIEAALAKANESGMDLVEVSPMAKPPVCKIMDYGKFKYETKKRANEAKKKQVLVKLKEIKLRPRTDQHDYGVRLRQAQSFLEEGHKVKVTIIFRGREITHREIGHKQLQEMITDLKDLAVVEQAPRMEGRTLFMVLGANPKVKAQVRQATTAPSGPPAPRPEGAPPPRAPGSTSGQGSSPPVQASSSRPGVGEGSPRPPSKV